MTKYDDLLDYHISKETFAGFGCVDRNFYDIEVSLSF